MDLLEIENEKLAQHGLHARLEMLQLQVAMDRLL